MNMVNELQGVFCEAFWAASLVSKLKCKHFKPVPALQFIDNQPDEEVPDLELLHRVSFLDDYFPDDYEQVGDAATIVQPGSLR